MARRSPLEIAIDVVKLKRGRHKALIELGDAPTPNGTIEGRHALVEAPISSSGRV
jgi:hypothetical protein